MAVWSLSTPVEIADGMLMECVGVGALQNMFQSWRLRQAEDAVSVSWSVGSVTVAGRVHLRGCELGRAHYCNALRHHDLITSVGMKIPRAHKAGLSGMSMDPSDHQEIFFVTVVEHGRLVLGLARIRRAFLIRDQ